MPRFELINSEITYKGRAFTIRKDHVKLPDGRSAHLDIVEHHGSVIIVPIDHAGNVIFVRQYRHAASVEMIELPAGTLEPDENPADCAAREIREETGFAADQIKEIGTFYLAPGYSTEYMHVYLATDLRHDPLEADADEFLSIEKLSAKETIAFAESGRMQDSKSLAALMLARPFLEKWL